jgi:D-arabinose 1-dehydrogenase-like Zn-dependent alcohol dehydrogenase
MIILVIDAQGGGIGKAAVSALKEQLPEAEVIAVGTNSAATAAMLKAGADHAAVGENAVAVCAGKADFIVGPIGIVIADAMYGEITEKMAAAVGRSHARRILIPIRHCDNIVVGVKDYKISSLIDDAVAEIKEKMK